VSSILRDRGSNSNAKFVGHFKLYFLLAEVSNLDINLKVSFKLFLTTAQFLMKKIVVIVSNGNYYL
jgi:hypothetical protein